jgi:hypothetical protein
VFLKYSSLSCKFYRSCVLLSNSVDFYADIKQLTLVSCFSSVSPDMHCSHLCRNPYAGSRAYRPSSGHIMGFYVKIGHRCFPPRSSQSLFRSPLYIINSRENVIKRVNKRVTGGKMMGLRSLGRQFSQSQMIRVT